MLWGVCGELGREEGEREGACGERKRGGDMKRGKRVSYGEGRGKWGEGGRKHKVRVGRVITQRWWS